LRAPRTLATCLPPQPKATDDGSCRWRGALRWGKAANGGGGARIGRSRSAIAELRRRFVDGPVLTMPARGVVGTSDTRAPSSFGYRYRVFSQFYPRSGTMGPSQCDRRLLLRSS
jgi:hypothetical protein